MEGAPRYLVAPEQPCMTPSCGGVVPEGPQCPAPNPDTPPPPSLALFDTISHAVPRSREIGFVSHNRSSTASHRGLCPLSARGKLALFRTTTPPLPRRPGPARHPPADWLCFARQAPLVVTPEGVLLRTLRIGFVSHDRPSASCRVCCAHHPLGRANWLCFSQTHHRHCFS